jgi:hypothetical protein
MFFCRQYLSFRRMGREFECPNCGGPFDLAGLAGLRRQKSAEHQRLAASGRKR